MTVDSRPVTLGEGQTPLVESRRIGPGIGMRHLLFKVETGNPTGSYKDRFAAAAVNDMLRLGRRHCVATSSGNTGSALAAYCAAANLTCEIAIVESAPSAKLRQMAAYGARLYRVRGFGLDASITDRTLACLARLGERSDRSLQISAFAFSPTGMAGVSSIADELAQQIDGPIDHLFVPAGGGGLALAVARGFEALVESGRLTSSPRLECVQPVGNDTIAGPLRTGARRARAVTCTTGISGLQVPSVLDGNEVVTAYRRSGGTGHTVTDAEVVDAQARLAAEEGLYAEPAGAAALAGMLGAVDRGDVDRTARVVCLVTGSGLKVSDSAERGTGALDCPTIPIDDLEARTANQQ